MLSCRIDPFSEELLEHSDSTVVCTKSEGRNVNRILKAIRVQTASGEVNMAHVCVVFDNRQYSDAAHGNSLEEAIVAAVARAFNLNQQLVISYAVQFEKGNCMCTVTSQAPYKEIRESASALEFIDAFAEAVSRIAIQVALLQEQRSA